MGVIARCVRVSKHVPMGRKCVRERERERERERAFREIPIFIAFYRK